MQFGLKLKNFNKFCIQAAFVGFLATLRSSYGQLWTGERKHCLLYQWPA